MITNIKPETNERVEMRSPNIAEEHWGLCSWGMTTESYIPHTVTDQHGEKHRVASVDIENANGDHICNVMYSDNPKAKMPHNPEELAEFIAQAPTAIRVIKALLATGKFTGPDAKAAVQLAQGLIGMQEGEK